MKLKNIQEIEAFLKQVDECKDDVWLTSKYGDKYNLKSHLTRYIAVAALLGEHGDELELWCATKEDTGKFIKFLSDHPDIA